MRTFPLRLFFVFSFTETQPRRERTWPRYYELALCWPCAASAHLPLVFTGESCIAFISFKKKNWRGEQRRAWRLQAIRGRRGKRHRVSACHRSARAAPRLTRNCLRVFVVADEAPTPFALPMHSTCGVPPPRCRCRSRGRARGGTRARSGSRAQVSCARWWNASCPPLLELPSLPSPAPFPHTRSGHTRQKASTHFIPSWPLDVRSTLGSWTASTSAPVASQATYWPRGASPVCVQVHPLAPLAFQMRHARPRVAPYP